MDTLDMEYYKPLVPYLKNWQFRARSHIPPPPTPVGYGCCENGRAGKIEHKQLDPVARCLLHPPLLGSDGMYSVKLIIRDTLEVGDEQNSQVVIAEVLESDPHLKGLRKGKRVVAKFYDPLYFNDKNGNLNSFLCVDKHYTHEAAVYTTLSELQGSLIPEFYGCFSLEIPVGESTKRHVRLTLIEWIQGLSMADIEPETLTQPERQNIMKTIVDFESLSYARDVDHTDMYPWNIIISDEISGQNRKVTFIDFGDALFTPKGYLPNLSEQESEYVSGTYISPRLRWHDLSSRANDFWRWINWDWQSWLEMEYPHAADSITEEMRELHT